MSRNIYSMVQNIWKIFRRKGTGCELRGAVRVITPASREYTKLCKVIRNYKKFTPIVQIYLDFSTFWRYNIRVGGGLGQFRTQAKIFQIGTRRGFAAQLVQASLYQPPKIFHSHTRFGAARLCLKCCCSNRLSVLKYFCIFL